MTPLNRRLAATSLWALASALGPGCAHDRPLQLGDASEVAPLKPACLGSGVAGCEADCSAGDPTACLAAAEAFEDGIGVRVNREKMAALERRGCELELGLACLQSSNNFARDDPQRTAYAEEACAHGERRGCRRAAMPKLHSRPIDKAALTAARDLLRVGCELGESIDCAGLGDLAQLGVGGRPNPAAAKRHYARACELGTTVACGKPDVDPERVWIFLMFGLVFDRFHAPNPSFAGIEPIHEPVPVSLTLCFPGIPNPTAEINRPSQRPDIDEAVLAGVKRWHFSLGPHYPNGKTVCLPYVIAVVPPR